MKLAELLPHVDRLMELLDTVGDDGSFIAAQEFLRVYGGPKNSFFERLNREGTSPYSLERRIATAREVLAAFRHYVEAGLHSAIPPEQQARIDVVTDVLGQAQVLLDDRRVHPAAPAVLIGASLEEYLRGRVDALDLTLGKLKPGLDAYAKVLLQAGFLSKQDMKDITSWAGLRNQAAHGEWEKVKDPDRIRLMLEGVNLFLRQKSR